MSLNPDLVRSRCQEIEESIERLKRFQKLTREEFLSDQDYVDVACYRLLVAMEAAMSLCYHVTAKRLNRVSENYVGCFHLLSEAGILPSDLSARLQRMARFRNLPIHMYWKVECNKVHEVINRDLDDLRTFSATITSLL